MDRPKSMPARTADAEAARKEREDREAAALRDNLRRRKEQARARQAPAAPGGEPEPESR